MMYHRMIPIPNRIVLIPTTQVGRQSDILFRNTNNWTKKIQYQTSSSSSAVAASYSSIIIRRRSRRTTSIRRFELLSFQASRYTSSTTSSSLTTTNDDDTAVLTIGIRRETYGKWERRAPLTPYQVASLLKQQQQQPQSASIIESTLDRHQPHQQLPTTTLKFIVQPSMQRIYRDMEYEVVGARIDNDLSDADIILGVKRPQSVTELVPNKTYLFFSHVRKGQSSNMKLLKELLSRHIQLIDYECITTTADTRNTTLTTTTSADVVVPTTTTTNTTTTSVSLPQRRLVSFGRYAGLAGTLDIFHELGKCLLYKFDGATTPFLSFPSNCIMFYNVNEAKTYIESTLSNRIVKSGIPIPEPIVFVITGSPNGAVYQGVMEALTLLPHSFVSVEELPDLFEKNNNSSINDRQQNQIYICHADPASIYEKDQINGGGDNNNNDQYNRHDFITNPTSYRSTFATKIVPYVHVIINATYWEESYPRIITKQQLKESFINGHDRLLVVADISCDINGSMEFLERTTTIENPYFTYDPIQECEVLPPSTTGRSTGSTDDDNDDDNDNPQYHHRTGMVRVLGVDILPSEFPRDSSEHFGTAVMKVLQELQYAKSCQEPVVRGIDPNFLSPGLAGAIITTSDGTLTNRFRYLETIMNSTLSNMEHHHKMTTASKETIHLLLKGHLFDTNLINTILDLVEEYCNEDRTVEVTFEQCNIPLLSNYNNSNTGDKIPRKSSVVLKLVASDRTTLKDVVNKINDVVSQTPLAEAEVHRLDADNNKSSRATIVEQKQNYDLPSSSSSISVEGPTNGKKVLLLGSGMVSKPFVELLSRLSDAVITVVSDVESDAQRVAKSAKNGGRAIGLNIQQDFHRVSDLIHESDIVVSLLPAPLHPVIAKQCIVHKKHMVTSSYESDEIRTLDEHARNAGITILNEVGLDPGLDHMSALKIIDTIQDRGGIITSFVSSCGGLPAPEASDNPLQYKFSWNPLGVLRASQNSATYRWDGTLINVRGENLLASALATDAFPNLGLECLPNRNALQYESIYRIHDAPTIVRGTLRYKGFSSVMDTFQQMGLLSTSMIVEENHTWNDLMLELMKRKNPNVYSFEGFVLKCCNNDPKRAQSALECIEWLGLMDNDATINPSLPVIENFSNILQSKLKYQAGERDMVVMQHTIHAKFEDGPNEKYSSRLQLFGDNNHTAMAKSVGYTVAASTNLILSGDGSTIGPGIILPTTPNIYLPILHTLSEEGVQFEEEQVVLPHDRH